MLELRNVYVGQNTADANAMKSTIEFCTSIG